MSAPTQEWVAEAVDLKEQGLSERAIADAVGKAPSTVHSALAKHAEARDGLDDVLEPAPPSSNGNGPHTVSAELAERLRRSAESQGDSSGVIPGQTTVDEHLGGSAVPPEDDPEHPDTLAAFRAEAGEAVGPMPPQPPAAQETVYFEEIRIDGTTQTSLNVGGKKPQTCEITFSGKATVAGFFKKGDILHIAGGAVRVMSEGAHDKLDKQTGIVTECVQKHTGKLIDLEIA